LQVGYEISDNKETFRYVLLVAEEPLVPMRTQAHVYA
jgi:hypothetical protein